MEKFECDVCGHVWTATREDFEEKQGGSCPECDSSIIYELGESDDN